MSLLSLAMVLGCSDSGKTEDTGFGSVGATESGDETATSTGDGDGDPGDGDGDGDTGDGDGDTGDGDGDPGPIPCQIPEANLAPAIPQVMLVLDKSGSMLTTWDHDNNNNTPNITRWRSLHNVVTLIINGFDAQMDFGAMLFPSTQAISQYSAAACVTAGMPEVPVGADGQAVLDTIPAANTNSIAGGTPGEDAIDVSGVHLMSLDPNRPRAIIYISDGAANCGDAAQNSSQLFENYDTKLPQTIQALWDDHEIPTYGVGIDMSTMLSPNQPDGSPDGITPWCKMDEVGEVGGKPKDEAPGMSCMETNSDNQDFYSASNEIELEAALQAIIEDAISCVVLLDPVPPFPDLLAVEVDGMDIPMVNDCDTEDGWVYVNPNGPYDAIELCGVSCQDLKVFGSADVKYFCDPG